MDYSKAIAISAAGLTAQKTRIEAATLNLANMHTSAAPGAAAFRPVTAVIRQVAAPFSLDVVGSAQPMMLAQAQIVAATGEQTRLAYEPGHPHADATGMVAYPAVDSSREMMTVVTALRAYEANLVALQVTRSLAAKALEIGGQ